MGDVDTKERIKHQAHDLIMQYGIRSVSMDDIANRLGISKKTIYQYYADKDELVDAIVEEVLVHNRQVCEVDRRKAENAIDELFLAKEFSAELMKAMNPSVLYDMQKYHPSAFNKFQKHRSEFLYNIIRQNILRGIEEGLYREDLKPELVARLRVESLVLPFSPEFQAHSKHSLAEMQEELIELYLFSLVNGKGHKLTMKYKQQYQNKS